MTVKELEIFLNNYKNFSISLLSFKSKYDRSRFSALFSGIQLIREVSEKYKPYFASNYNIFNILKINTKEVINKMNYRQTINVWNPLSISEKLLK